MIAPQQKEKKPHIKKPLNAFMLFMKEKRAEVIKECTLKESAAINQILGKMVGSVSRMTCTCNVCLHVIVWFWRVVCTDVFGETLS